MPTHVEQGARFRRRRFFAAARVACAVLGLAAPLASCLPDVDLNGRACACEGNACTCSDGFVCDRPRNVCLRAGDACDPPCDDGSTCQDGACVAASCEPACGQGQACKGGTCVDAPCEPACEAGFSCRAGSCAPTVFVRASASVPTTQRASLSLPIPAAVEAGDFLIAVVFARLATDATHPPGWDVIATNAGSCGGWRAFHLTRVADGTETTFDETFSSAEQITAGLVAYGGVDPSAPVAATSGVRIVAGADMDNPPWVAPSVTTIFPGTRVVSALTDLSGGPFQAPAGTDARLDAGTLFVFDAFQPAAGPSTAYSVEGRADGCGTAATWALSPRP